MTKDQLIDYIETASPETLERLLTWFSAIEGSVHDSAAIDNHLEWLHHGAMLRLESAQLMTVLDYLIVERRGSDDPDPDPSEIANHRRVSGGS